jgi:Flp pilus assembly protein TadG
VIGRVCSDRLSRLRGDDSGAVTVEAAIVLAAIVVVLVLCLGAVLAGSMHVQCVDAAREAARLAARGDDVNAVAVARKVAPAGAEVAVRKDGSLTVATVTAHTPLLPLLDITARAVAAVEPNRNNR